MKLPGFLLVCLLAALAVTQGVTDHLLPSGEAPENCLTTASGAFEISAIDLGIAKRDDSLMTRAVCGAESALRVTLANGILKDGQGRIAYIADNFQFQFDDPPQAGAITTAGFSLCKNGSLALGPTAIFYGCVSGTFSNVYDRYWAAQCSPVAMIAIPCGDTAVAAGVPGGEIIGTSMVQTTLVTVLADGQPQIVPTEVPVAMCQILDGQVQIHTTPCGDVPAPTGAPATQIGDGQIQIPTPGAPATQIGDGQVQIPPAGKPATQIPDGQFQIPAPGATGLPSGFVTAVTPPAVTSPLPAPPTEAPSTGSGAEEVAQVSIVALIVCALVAIAL